MALTGTDQRYWHKDHLGSIVASTNYNPGASPTVTERLAYEPFGKRRFTAGQFDPTGTIDAQTTSRGFTGHEHLDGLDFIHMNARVYDPDIGRFLSPDPTVPGAHNPQAFNRYTYAFNSPLNLIDPDGFEPAAGPHGYSDGSKDQPTRTGSSSSGSGAGTPDNLGQGRPTTGADPKASKNADGLGFKGNISELFKSPYQEDDGPAPIVTMGQNFGALAAWGVGKITGDKALADAAMEGMNETRTDNLNALNIMLSFGRAPKLGGVPRTGPKGVDPKHHNANVTVRDSAGNIISHERVVSGNMTVSEKALGFPKGSLASHTEARAVKKASLESSQSMTITGQKPPCPSCKGAMNQAARNSDATIKYQWRQNGSTQSWTAKP